MFPEHSRLILGGPGCGKTTRLLEIVERELLTVPPHQIAFVTFTKAAAREASERAAEKFALDAEEDLPWFRTIHSLVYKQLGLTREEVFGTEDWKRFVVDVMGEAAPELEDEGGVEVMPGMEMNDLMKMMRMVGLANTRMDSLRRVWEESDELLSWWELKQFDRAYSEYKTTIGKTDFTDMLLNYVTDGEPVPVRVAVIDEAQDLTRAQWEVVRRAFRDVERLYIGGDDDQSIYTWAGADVGFFLGLKMEREVLDRSYRLPSAIYGYSQRLIRRIKARYDKPYRPHSYAEGSVNYHSSLQSGPSLDGAGSWLLLARNRYMLGALIAYARESNVVYAVHGRSAINAHEVEAIRIWETLGKVPELTATQVRVLFKHMYRAMPQLRENRTYRPVEDLGLEIGKRWEDVLTIYPERAAYYKACAEKGEDLLATPRVRIDTIHGVKGREADNVLMLTDVSRRTAQSAELDPDGEVRVFYVGATRARQDLHIVVPQTDFFFDA